MIKVCMLAICLFTEVAINLQISGGGDVELVR